MAIDAPLEPGHTFVVGDTLTAALLNKALTLAKAVVPTPFSVAAGGTGGTSVATAQKNIQAMGRLEGWVEYTDAGVAVTIGTLPADSFVYDVLAHATEAFNSGTSDLLEVGWDSDNDALGTSTSVATTGVKTPTAGASDGYNATQQTVKAYYASTGTAPTTGKVLVVVLFCQVTATP